MISKIFFFTYLAQTKNFNTFGGISNEPASPMEQFQTGKLTDEARELFSEIRTCTDTDRLTNLRLYIELRPFPIQTHLVFQGAITDRINEIYAQELQALITKPPELSVEKGIPP